MGNIDCVFKVGERIKWSPDHQELKYAIRSVCKNFKDLRNVVIVGTKPDWFTGYHILADDPFKKNKDANIILKILTACNDDRISSEFVNISDDQLIIYPITVALLKPYTINSDIRRIKKNRGISTYGKRVIATLATLEKEGLPTHLYESHIPVLLNKQKYKEILSKYNYTIGNGLCGNTLYFNNLVDNGEQPVENVRGFIKKSLTMGQIITEFRGKLFFGYQRKALNKNLKEYLQKTFKEKTIYEK